MLRKHDTESNKFTFKTLERGAVPDHQPLADAGFKYLERGQVWLDDLQKEKVCICLLYTSDAADE